MLCMLFKYVINKHIAKYYFMLDQPVLITTNSSARSLVDQKTVLMTALWPQYMNVYAISETQSDSTVCALKIILHY